VLEGPGHRPAFGQKLQLANGAAIERDAAEAVVEIDGAALQS